MAAPEVLSWTNRDPRESQLYGPGGVTYRFQVSAPAFVHLSLSPMLILIQTLVDQNNMSTTTLFRALRKGKEERVARLEWGPGGALGRAQIGKVSKLSMRLVDRS